MHPVPLVGQQDGTLTWLLLLSLYPLRCCAVLCVRIVHCLHTPFPRFLLEFFVQALAEEALCRRNESSGSWSLAFSLEKHQPE